MYISGNMECTFGSTEEMLLKTPAMNLDAFGSWYILWTDAKVFIIISELHSF